MRDETMSKALVTDKKVGVTDTALNVQQRHSTDTAMSGSWCVCIVCLKHFQTKRRGDAKTCGDNCRSHLQRERNKIAKKQEHILWSIGDIQDMVKSADPLMVKRAKKALCEIMEQSIAACREEGLS